MIIPITHVERIGKLWQPKDRYGPNKITINNDKRSRVEHPHGRRVAESDLWQRLGTHLGKRAEHPFYVHVTFRFDLKE
jgi:hypothetical protein